MLWGDKNRTYEKLSRGPCLNEFSLAQKHQ